MIEPQASERTLQPFVGNAAKAALSPLRRINIYDGAVRSGKTVVSIVKFIAFVRTAPPGLLMLVGKTERTAKQNIIDPLMRFVGPKYARYSIGTGILYLMGRQILVIGANDEKAEGKIRGVTLAGAYGDEITLWPESFFIMLLSRLSLKGAAFIGTTNPDTPAHWLNKKYLRRQNELDLARFVFTLDDNPYLDPTFLEQIKKEYTGLWYKRMILGEWCVAEGSIFDMLDPDRHLVKTLPGDLTTVASYGAGDYGTTNPTTFMVLSMGAEKLYVHHEYRYASQEVGRQKTDKEYSVDYFKWKQEHGYPLKRMFVDPAAASFILQLWRDGERGIVAPGDNAVLDGLRELGNLLGNDRLAFHEPTTEHLWEELVSYAWDSDASERGEDKPVKVNDHGPDALRYGVRGTRQIWRKYLEGGPVNAAA